MNVAVITRSLRAAACVEYMASASGSPRYIILTADPGAFDSERQTANFEIMRLSPGSLPIDRIGLVMATRRKFLRWARSGSRFGELVESAARRVKALLRGGSVLKPVDDVSPAGRRPLYDRLVEINSDEPIEQIFVFDLFDLPAVLAFGGDFDINVVVR